MIACTNCGRPYPEKGAPHHCPKCGGLFDWKTFPEFDPAQVDDSQPGLWRYRQALSASPLEVAPVSLGEGRTPLVWADCLGQQVAFKCEFANPTGSFKDRGMTVLLSFLKSRGITSALEDSSGNAGASFAAYAARAGIQAGVYVPVAASGPKIQQARAYGAEIFPISGSRADVSRALEAKISGIFNKTAYASHAWLPQNLPGYATAAYEIVEQIGGAPGAVLCPVGQGGFFLGLYRGFVALQRAGVITTLPRMIGVQSRACAPLWTLANAGYSAYGLVMEGPTVAEGIRVRAPLRTAALMRIVESGHGEFLAVDEAEILPGRDQLARRGLYVEPTSAVVWPALAQILPKISAPVVAVLTGSGLKSGQ
ncbi:MAG: hypothetical protein CO094_04620 [Anaerolineae bacterium CG_4_9_14_3_um_filter_57_17]|nr:pyridoxal-phosphate dependent enzyme [bacterium]NCT19875.1 pyridoxal-phosphate dependent enzyme [bacterium]OIO83531.1 MAG: hypothetical protein AUK01_12410 [Anaerolineae bacterium CG2_30_57_67]PJB67249.1 MAG: hypothetical protein CO094_04620 [Anaerolineae bacterium CG_4_9_14_3_um_filter_57_17]